LEPIRDLGGEAIARSRRSCYAAVAIAIAGLVAPSAGRAHDFWVERAGAGFVIRHGHRGGETLAIEAAKVKAIRCGDGARPAKDVLTTASYSPDGVRFSAACAVVSVFHDGGSWSLTPDGERNLPRSKVENVVRSWASRQYAKWVDAKSPGAGAVQGDELEIVPVTDLAKARGGDKVTVRVLSAAHPVPGAVVAIAHRPLGETDSKGEIRLRLRPGIESISTAIRRPDATPEADVDVIEASLTFEVRK
jgi:uncharacterized GH25 family protein